MMAHRSFSDENVAAAPVGRDGPGGEGVIALGTAHFYTDDRRLSGRRGEARLEPRVAQLLVVLSNRRGAVVRRGELQRAIWPDVTVGDDSLNRLVASLRRALRDTGVVDDVQVETISKSGYRLTGQAILERGARDAPARERESAWLSRRRAVGLAGGAAMSVAAGVTAWVPIFRTAKTENSRVALLIEQARVAQGMGLADADESGTGFLNEAIALDPTNAAAWGLLALAHHRSLENGQADEADGAAQCEIAARRALALDPKEPNARAALAILPPIYGDWLASERRYDEVLRADPGNSAVLIEKGLLLMSVGRCRESLAVADRALRLAPFAPVLHYHRGFRLSAVGKTLEADRTLDRALQLWPRHAGLRYARFLVFAFSGRDAAALRMLDADAGAVPLPPPLAEAWRRTLLSRVRNDRKLRRDAAAAFLAQALEHTAAAVNAMLALCMLGEVDAAFQVAEGYLLRRGPSLGNLHTPGKLAVAEQRWRKTMMLFVPATANMRADPRFAALTEDMGLADYWRRGGNSPDFLQT